MNHNYKRIAGMVWLIALCASAGYAQQQFTHTVTKANKNCNATCSVFDVPALNNNPAAVILITPIGNAASLNPHPIGAYYMYLKKWSVFNLDGAAITEGAKYDVQYFADSGPDRFVYMVPRQVHLSDIPYIDREGLNGNPNAQIRVTPTSHPTHGAFYNRDDVKVEYDAKVGKWFVANLNRKPVPWESVYNVFLSPGGVASTTSGTPPNPSTTSPTPANPITVSSGRDGRIPGPPNIALPQPASTPSVGAPPPTTLTSGPSSSTPAKGPLSSPVLGRWILRDDFQPSIPPNSEILLFIPGMDSRSEEADDITRQLFALRASGYQPQAGLTPTAPSSASPNAAMIPVLQQLLEKYKGCILEKYETQQDMVSRGLSANLSGLTNTVGLQVRNTEVKCVAGNPCSLAMRATQFLLLQGQANRGDATNFESTLESIIPADCFLCAKHQEMHTKHVHCTMDAGGNSGFQGPAFEGCKAGVDIAKLTSDILNDLTNFVNDITGIKLAETEMIGGPSIATNFKTFHFDSPESCDHPDIFAGGQRVGVVPFEWGAGGQLPLYYEPLIPLTLLDTYPAAGKQINVPAARNIGMNEGRLRPDLREAAALADPLNSLRLASYKYAVGNVVVAQAFADLSVTGRKTFEAFRHALPKEEFCQSLIPQRPSQLSDADVLNGCHKALDRAYRVANFLRTGQRGDTPEAKAAKIKERSELGWIAVSGEDDQPHRPVNTPSSDYPQFDMPVKVDAKLSALPDKTVILQARFVIAQSQTANPSGKNLVVISVDLPSSGYTTNIDYNLVSTLIQIGHPKETRLPVPFPLPPDLAMSITAALISFGLPPPPPVIPPGVPIPDFEATGNAPVLDFYEDFIVSFANSLHQKTPIKSNIKAVMGGSLGGNLTFRLGRRPNVDWLPTFIVWSPASIWNSLGEGNDILKHLGPHTAWERANKALVSPSASDRAKFFGAWDEATAWPIIREAQSGTWTSEYYACKLSSVAGARLNLHETYDAKFLAWHWRLGAEQLLYSHQTNDPMTKKPRYLLNQKPMLLACGLEDQVPYNEICPATQKTAKLMTMTPGRAIFLDKTGHSLDNERRMFFAQQILDFLK